MDTTQGAQCKDPFCLISSNKKVKFMLKLMLLKLIGFKYACWMNSAHYISYILMLKRIIMKLCTIAEKLARFCC